MNRILLWSLCIAIMLTSVGITTTALSLLLVLAIGVILGVVKVHAVINIDEEDKLDD